MKISLKAARVNAELTQKKVAQQLAISNNTLINWESGKTSPNYLQLQKLCKIYKCKMDDIFLNY